MNTGSSVVESFYRNAPHYDIEYVGVVGDIPFFVKLAGEFAKGGSVLEFCAGTGRITIPLAREGMRLGFNVVGVDITLAMLELATQKLAAEPVEVRENANLVLGDMRCVDVGFDSFDLVIVPFNSFMHMTTQEDQLTALASSFSHVKPGGYFLADVFLPDVARLARNMGPSWLEVEKVVRIEEEGLMLVRSGAFTYSPHNQLLSATWVYQLFETEGGRRLVDSYWSPFEIRVIFAGEWRLLLEWAGFEIVAEWGSFDRETFGENSKRMLFLCRKPKSMIDS